MRKFVGVMCLVPLALFVVALAFSYDYNLQQALYTLAGLSWLVFSTWAGILLVREK